MRVNKKSKKKEKKITQPKKTNSFGVVDLSPEKPFDFSGLPDRNLKKNLGC